MQAKVLVVATSKLTKGGITSVLRRYNETKFWTDWNCYWIETHRDSNLAVKLGYFLKGLLVFLFKLKRAAIVHIHFSGLSSLKRKRIFFLLSSIFGKKIIAHYHGANAIAQIDENEIEKYKEIFNLSDHIIVLSELWKVNLMKQLGISDNKISVLYNPCNIYEDVKYTCSNKYILYAGKLNERKGYMDLIKAFAIFQKYRPDWRLILAGDGEVLKAQNLIKQLKVESTVDCVGWVSGYSKKSLFSGATLFCLPSYAEGFPMAVLDALSFHLPILTTPVGGIPDVAKPDVNMVLTAQGDINMLSEKLKYLSDPEILKRLSQESASLAKSKFAIDKIIGKLELIYKCVEEN